MPMEDGVLTLGKGTARCAPRAIVEPSKLDPDLTSLGGGLTGLLAKVDFRKRLRVRRKNDLPCVL